MASRVGRALLSLQQRDTQMIAQLAYKAGLKGVQAPRTPVALGLNTCFRQGSSFFLSLSASISSLTLAALSFWPCQAMARRVLLLPVRGHVSRTFQTQSGVSGSSHHPWYFSKDSGGGQDGGGSFGLKTFQQANHTGTCL